MEIYVNYLAIEVTRRCNMKCEHCLRGDAQNLDISTAVLSGIAKHIHPASVIFTGGEPSLNVPAIKRYFELAERYDTMPAAFYVATNGATSKEQMRDLALTLLESYAKMLNRFGSCSDANSPHQMHDYVIFKSHEATLMRRYHENVDSVVEHIREFLPALDLQGQWSIDVMQNGDDFWIIDMAVAENSAFYDCVPESLRRPSAENWIPDILKPNN